ncbi:hypothetical protein PF010_g11164 [Phytophthora fragariae]|uniref:Uncharacterized protein n=1 Tax=Phytophthora fragariae TaxID=53985 RepID=A0A6G0L6S6_9STRA|nr:hypothetical protein PF010_g11164 [Phytophthora fragariae]
MGLQAARRLSTKTRRPSRPLLRLRVTTKTTILLLATYLRRRSSCSCSRLFPIAKSSTWRHLQCNRRRLQCNPRRLQYNKRRQLRNLLCRLLRRLLCRASGRALGSWGHPLPGSHCSTTWAKDSS